MTQANYPIQPIFTNERGTLRFKANPIVRYLLDNGGIDLNQIAALAANGMFTNADQEQFAMLIGYSLSGFGELNFVSNETYKAAAKMAEGQDEKDAKIAVLQETLGKVKTHLKAIVPELFNIHEDDLP